MVKIALRRYIREISNLIDNGRSTEAIKHCMWILKLFPKHLDTYRVLGKAYLESHLFTDGEDILKRLLSSRPDDFFAHLGLSIVRENQNALDEAIWHMERAFEAQATNNAVEEELRQLYGKRDGIEPPKVRMTRGALVRLYSKGDLLQQGISEARAALQEDPSRLDIQVLLASMLSRSGRNSEAAELSSLLLSRLPFCFEANRILSDTLPDSSQDETSNPYRLRIIAMDPYFNFLKPGHHLVETISENLVMIEKLEIALDNSSASEGLPGKTIDTSSVRESDSVEWVNAIPIVEQSFEKQSLNMQEEPVTSGDNNPEGTDSKPTELPDWLEAETSPKIGTPEIQPDKMSLINQEQSFLSDHINIPEMEMLNTKEATMDGDGTPLPIIPADDEELPDWLKGSLDEDLSSSDKFDLESTKPVEKSIEEIINPLETILEPPPLIDSGTSGPEIPSVPEWLQEQDKEKQADKDHPHPAGEDKDPLPEWLREKDVDAVLDQELGNFPQAIAAEVETGTQFSEAGSAASFPGLENERNADIQESETLPAMPDSSGQVTAETTGSEPSYTAIENQITPESNRSGIEGFPEQDFNIANFDLPSATSDENSEKPESLDIEAWRESLQSTSPTSEQEPSMVDEVEVTQPSAMEQEEVTSPFEFNTPQGERETNPSEYDFIMEEKGQEPSLQVPVVGVSEGESDSETSDPETDIHYPGDHDTSGSILDTSTYQEEAPVEQEGEQEPVIDTPESILNLDKGSDSTNNEATTREGIELAGLVEQTPEISIIDESEISGALPGWLSELETEKPSEDTVSSWLKDLESQESPKITNPEEESKAQVLEPIGEEQDGIVSIPELKDLAAVEVIKEAQNSRLTDAQSAIENGELELALQRYQSLISETQALPEVIEDLKKALDRYPIDINLWQLLGDAYFKDHQIQSALDAYTKAEELIR